jgi:RHS repeat-associated protein
MHGCTRQKFFELSNHLGNVLAVISDFKTWTTEGAASFYTAQVKSATDYYPFGQAIAGRKYNDNTYRYSFNGKENDNTWGAELIQDYGFRIYSSSIAKFLSVDPLFQSYPYYTPYQFAGNNPIEFIDLDGAEPSLPKISWSIEDNYTYPYKNGPAIYKVEGFWIYERAQYSNPELIQYMFYNEKSQKWENFSPLSREQYSELHPSMQIVFSAGAKSTIGLQGGIKAKAGILEGKIDGNIGSFQLFDLNLDIANNKAKGDIIGVTDKFVFEQGGSIAAGAEIPIIGSRAEIGLSAKRTDVSYGNSTTSIFEGGLKGNLSLWKSSSLDSKAKGLTGGDFSKGVFGGIPWSTTPSTSKVLGAPEFKLGGEATNILNTKTNLNYRFYGLDFNVGAALGLSIELKLKIGIDVPQQKRE